MGADALLQTFDAKLAAVPRLYLDDNNGKLKEGDDVFRGDEGNLGVDRKGIVVRFGA